MTIKINYSHRGVRNEWQRCSIPWNTWRGNSRRRANQFTQIMGAGRRVEGVKISTTRNSGPSDPLSAWKCSSSVGFRPREQLKFPWWIWVPEIVPTISVIPGLQVARATIFQGISNGLLAVEFEMYDPGKLSFGMFLLVFDRFFVHSLKGRSLIWKKFVSNLSHSFYKLMDYVVWKIFHDIVYIIDCKEII